MGTFGTMAGSYFLPIADDSKLFACVHREKGQTFVTIRGPCGEGHTMNLEEARNLRTWLVNNIPTDEEDTKAHRVSGWREARVADGMWESA